MWSWCLAAGTVLRSRRISSVALLPFSEHLCVVCSVLLPVGTILRGRRISSVALFGVMVELMPGKTGLVHLSELGEEGQVLHEVPPQYTVGRNAASTGCFGVLYLLM
jgi:polyribonucleotide nucleotidyltransferase